MSEVQRSLSEIRATCTRAARGAGCSWGMAEEAGLAVRQLEAHGLPGVAALAMMLDAPRRCACSGGKYSDDCGLARMAELSDAPPARDLRQGRVAGPLLLVAPFLGRAEGWRIAWLGGAVHTGPDGAAMTGAPPPAVAESLSIAHADPPAQLTPPDWRSRAVPAAAWARLEEFAARTLVPESDASRAGGAGPDAADSD